MADYDNRASRYKSIGGGTRNSLTPGAVYRGTITSVRADGKVRVRVPLLGNQVLGYGNALRGPETSPYVKGDQVVCVFLNLEFSELFVLGRFNYQPKFRNVGINVHDPQYPLHIAGVDHEYGIAVQIDRTSAVGSSRADLQMHKTIVGAGAATAAAASGGGTFSDEAAVDGFQGDFYVYDYHTEKFLIQHTGGQNTAGGLSGNMLNTYLAIKATGKHGNPTGTFDRTLYYIQPMMRKRGVLTEQDERLITGIGLARKMQPQELGDTPGIACPMVTGVEVGTLGLIIVTTWAGPVTVGMIFGPPTMSSTRLIGTSKQTLSIPIWDWTS